MIAHILQRIRKGKKSKYWTARIALKRGDKPQEFALGLTDKLAAQAALAEKVVELQQEAYKVIPKKSYREAAGLPLGKLIDEYRDDLTAQSRSEAHVKESISRVRKVVTKCKWQRFRDVTPRSFLAWRKNFAKLRAAKTVKEYQVSVEAWLNWLAENEYIERNPLAKVKYPETRGNAVRKSRDLTIPELRALFTTAPTDRALAYETLVYTGQRCCEIAALRRAQLDLGERPCIRLYDNQTKDLDNRAIPLYPPLAERLRAALPADMAPDALAFPHFPTLEQFYVDIKFAGIERKDASGRVVNMHALRKTFQTMSVNAGVNQRATQAILGHSDANTTANIYTHVPSLGLDIEIQKLPRWEKEKELSSGAVTKKDKNDLILEQLHGLAELIKSIDCKDLNVETTAETLAARHGFEP